MHVFLLPRQLIKRAFKTRLVQKVRALLPDAKLIYLFGSQADDSARSSSDIDIAVFLGHKLDPIERFDIQETLAIEFDQDIDLIDLLNTSTVAKTNNANLKCRYSLCISD